MQQLKNFNLLYVEDENHTRDNYSKSFQLIFKEVFEAKNYEEAIDNFKNNHIDIVLLDIELNQKKNGFDIAKKIKQLNKNSKIIFLTGYDEKDFILNAINNNINGYIIKPLNLEKMTEIINDLINNNKESIEFKQFTFNLNTYELYDENNKCIHLGKKENHLLQFFLKNKDKVLSRELIEYEIWGEPLISDTTLKNLIASLRKKIGKETIINISKIGWKIEIS